MMDALPSAAAGPPGNSCGSDGPTGNARGSESETRSFRMVSVLGETSGRGNLKSGGNLRGCDRSTLLGTARALGEALGVGTSASVLGEALGSCAPTPKRNSRGSDGPSRERTPARGSVSEEPKFPSSSFFLVQRSVSSPLSPRKCRHTAPSKQSPSSARHVRHLGRTSPNFSLFLHAPSGDSQSASRVDLVRASSSKAQTFTPWKDRVRSGSEVRSKVL